MLTRWPPPRIQNRASWVGFPTRRQCYPVLSHSGRGRAKRVVSTTLPRCRAPTGPVGPRGIEPRYGADLYVRCPPHLPIDPKCGPAAVSLASPQAAGPGIRLVAQKRESLCPRHSHGRNSPQLATPGSHLHAQNCLRQSAARSRRCSAPSSSAASFTRSAYTSSRTRSAFGMDSRNARCADSSTETRSRTSSR